MKPWVKVHRPRLGSRFEVEVSAMARLTFRGLLPYADEEGRIYIEAKGEVYQALGRLLGIPARERRPLKRYVDEWIQHGCVLVTCVGHARAMCLPGFKKWQGNHKADAGQSQGAHMAGESTAPNPPKSLAPISQDKTREEGEKKDEIRTREAPPEVLPEPPPKPAPDPSPTRTPFGHLEDLIRDRRKQLGKAWRRGHRDYDPLTQAAAMVQDQADLEGTDFATVAGECLDGWAADPWVSEHGYPVGSFLTDPMKYRGRSKRPSKVDARRLQEEIDGLMGRLRYEAREEVANPLRLQIRELRQRMEGAA